ncbi:hypothetical protein HPP92_001783 [Vanilla planifolia]|uniref:Uncharacterized protein n=1 Tax=Vanilla planifolia TaxID=51239 RepID=A0A835VFN6_VANPL|nr:hypothetical protein HPP92_001783 [Vanilla planifolia]
MTEGIRSKQCELEGSIRVRSAFGGRQERRQAKEEGVGATERKKGGNASELRWKEIACGSAVCWETKSRSLQCHISSDVEGSAPLCKTNSVHKIK